MSGNNLNNVLVIGWNSCSFQVINFINSVNNDAKITLLDNAIEEYPLPFVKLIKGNPTDRKNLIDANIHSAEYIIITANQQKTEREADEQTLINLLTIRTMNEKAYCIAQTLLRRNIQHAKNVGADEVIFTNDIIGRMLNFCVLKK
ncbi:NAD-binding protein [Metabacillus herbersteinensis]|uniref:NAD-binding protein n=1 Tax=Metabacillus herbersteinensis TaxID=283816 RepID=A0ABV6GM23_9BACI